MSASGYQYFQVEEIVKETNKAFLIRFEGNEEMWVPKSQIADADDLEEGLEQVTVAISDWFCQQEGLEGDQA